MKNSKERQQFFDFSGNLIPSDKPDSLIQSITPEKARIILTHSTYNRILNQARVDFYASMMEAGRWVQGQALIALDTNNRLINGHHVLNAIIKTGLTQDCTIQVGLNPAAVEFYDSKKAVRNGKDVLAFLSNGRDVRNGNELLYIVRKYFMWHLEKTGDDVERAYWLLDHLDIVSGTLYRRTGYFTAQMKGVSDFFAAGVLIVQYNSVEQWHTFVDDLLDNKYAGKYHPVNSLARYARTGNKGATGRLDIFLATIKAWNATITGQEIRRFHFDENTHITPLVKK